MNGKELNAYNPDVTNFDWYTKDIENLTRLLEAVQGDALEAEGCMLNLTLPPGDPDDVVSWENWLKSPCDFEI